MTTFPEPPLSIDEIHGVAERGFALLEWYEESQGEDPPGGRSAARVLVAGEAALRYAATVAAMHDAVALLPLVRDVALALVARDRGYRDPLGDVSDALTALLRKSEVDALVRELAAHANVRVRIAVASALSPDTPGGLDVLRELARDPERTVRDLAKKRLGAERLPPWWDSVFGADPIARLPERGRARAEAALRTLVELYDPTTRSREDVSGKIAAALEPLPAPLVLEALHRLLRGAVGEPLLRAVLPRALRCSGAEVTILALLRGWDWLPRHRAKQVIVGVAEDLSRAGRAALSRGLLDAVRVDPPGDEAEDAQGWQVDAAELACALAPPRSDPTPFFDLAVARLADKEEDHLTSALLTVFKRPDVATRRAEARVVGAILGADGKLWSAFGYDRDTVLDTVRAARLRPFAERFLTHEDDERAKWAVEQLVDRCRDPRKDGPLLGVVARFFADVRLREFIRRPLAVSFSRARLRAGGVSFAEAAQTLVVVDSLWGGLAHADMAEAEKDQRKGRRAHAATLGPRELRGPITAEEWARYREAFAASPLDSVEDLGRALDCIPPGPRSAADDALVERATARLVEEEDIFLARSLLEAIAATPCAADFDRLDRVAARVRRAYSRQRVESTRERVSAVLGVPAPKPAPPTPTDEDEWLDDD